MVKGWKLIKEELIGKLIVYSVAVAMVTYGNFTKNIAKDVATVR